eukprot:364927-Chlamydomonas_euryale.AAC.7
MPSPPSHPQERPPPRAPEATPTATTHLHAHLRQHLWPRHTSTRTCGNTYGHDTPPSAPEATPTATTHLHHAHLRPAKHANASSARGALPARSSASGRALTSAATAHSRQLPCGTCAAHSSRAAAPALGGATFASHSAAACSSDSVRQSPASASQASTLWHPFGKCQGLLARRYRYSRPCGVLPSLGECASTHWHAAVPMCGRNAHAGQDTGQLGKMGVQARVRKRAHRPRSASQSCPRSAA